MKRGTWLIVVLAVIPIFAASGQAHRQQIDALVDRWTDALRNEDIDDFLDCYWPDAVRYTYFPGEDPSLVEGHRALRIEEEQSFENLDFASMGLIYDEPVRFFPETDPVVYIYPNSQFGFMDVFEMERRGGRYKIIRQYLIPHPR